jgi:hypothetical protein
MPVPATETEQRLIGFVCDFAPQSRGDAVLGKKRDDGGMDPSVDCRRLRRQDMAGRQRTRVRDLVVVNNRAAVGKPTHDGQIRQLCAGFQLLGGLKVTEGDRTAASMN